MNGVFFFVTMPEICNFAMATWCATQMKELVFLRILKHFLNNIERDTFIHLFSVRNIMSSSRTCSEHNKLIISYHVSSCFKINSLRTNPGKFQFMVMWANENDSFFLVIGKTESELNVQTYVTLPGTEIDKRLKFKSHIEELRRKASYKLYALRRIWKIWLLILPNVFINIKFSYILLIWKFAGKSSIAKIC